MLSTHSRGWAVRKWLSTICTHQEANKQIARSLERRAGGPGRAHWHIISPPVSAVKSESCYDLYEKGPFGAKGLEENDLVPAPGVVAELTRVREPDLLPSHRTSRAGHLGSGRAQETQHMAHDSVPSPPAPAQRALQCWPTTTRLLG